VADKAKDMWLKVLVSLLIVLILSSFGFTATKLDKDAMNKHEQYEKEKFEAVMEYLIRIDKKT